MKRAITAFMISAVFAMMGFSAIVFADAVVEPDPAAYVSVDAGTGFELTLDEQNLVTGVDAVEETGDAVIDGIDITGQPLDEAIGQLIDEAIAEGVLPADGTVPVEITVTTEDTDQTAAEEEIVNQAITDEITGAIEDLDVPVVVTYQNAALERIALARTLGITPGKLNLIQKYAASTVDPAAVIITDWTDKSVKEIMKAIKENRKAATEPEVTADPAGTTDPTGTDTLAPVEPSDESTPTITEKSSNNGSHENKGGRGGDKGHKNKH